MISVPAVPHSRAWWLRNGAGCPHGESEKVLVPPSMWPGYDTQLRGSGNPTRWPSDVTLPTGRSRDDPGTEWAGVGLLPIRLGLQLRPGDAVPRLGGRRRPLRCPQHSESSSALSSVQRAAI